MKDPNSAFAYRYSLFFGAFENSRQRTCRAMGRETIAMHQKRWGSLAHQNGNGVADVIPIIARIGICMKV